MRYFIILLISSVLIPGFSHAVNDDMPNDDTIMTVNCSKIENGPTSFNTTCAPINNPHHLQFSINGEGKVQDKQMRDMKLTIKSGSQDAQEFPMESYTSELEMIDVDFDGNDDLRLLTGEGMGNNRSYAYWLYDPKSNKFNRREDIDALSGDEIDFNTAEKTIHISGSRSYSSWGSETYRWHDGKLILGESSSDGGITLNSITGLKKTKGQNYYCVGQNNKYDNSQLLTSITIYASDCADSNSATKSYDDARKLITPGTGYQISEKASTTNENELASFTITYDPPIKDNVTAPTP